MNINCIAVGSIQTNCYIVRGDGFQMVVDPGDQANEIKSLLVGAPTHIVLTHTHFDHIGAVSDLKSEYPDAVLCYCPLDDMDIGAIARLCGMDISPSLPAPDTQLKEGDCVCGFTVLHTPGHTPGGICLYDAKDGVLISGDTLFCHGFGRTDLGGNKHQLVASLHRLFDLPPETKVYPGHGDMTTIGSEREYYHVV